MSVLLLPTKSVVAGIQDNIEQGHVRSGGYSLALKAGHRRSEVFVSFLLQLVTEAAAKGDEVIMISRGGEEEPRQLGEGRGN